MNQLPKQEVWQLEQLLSNKLAISDEKKTRPIYLV